MKAMKFIIALVAVLAVAGTGAKLAMASGINFDSLVERQSDSRQQDNWDNDNYDRHMNERNNRSDRMQNRSHMNQPGNMMNAKHRGYCHNN